MKKSVRVSELTFSVPLIYKASTSRSGGIRTRGLLVPNSRIWISDRPMRVFAIFPRLCNEKPRISENFRFFHAIFKVDILPFRSILKVQFTLQPGRLQHPPGHALPFGQTFGSMPIFSVKSPRDLSYCARLIAPCSRNVSNNSFCRR